MQRVVTEGALRFLSEVGHYIRNSLPASELRPVLLTLLPEELNSIISEFSDNLGKKWIECRIHFKDTATLFTTWSSKQEVIEIASCLVADPSQLSQPVRPLVGFGGKYVHSCFCFKPLIPITK